jgi:hypothetical protein
MRHLARLAGLLVFSWSLQVRAPLMAQDSSSIHVASTDGKVTDSLSVTDSVGADSTKSKENAHSTPTSLETALPGVKISGYAEASYTYSTAALGGGPVVGRSFDRNQDEFMPNVVKLVFDKPFASDRLNAGFHVDLLFGQNATLLQSAGLKLGDQGDIEQAFVTLNVPTGNGNGLQFKVGKWVTLMGVEVIEDVLNPNWSEGNQFLYVENFTGTGAEVDYKWNKYFDTEFRVFNGWDVVQDNNTHKSFMGRLGITPDEKTVLAVVGYTGPEQAGNDDAIRRGVNVVANRKVGSKLSMWGQFDYGKEDANPALPDPTQDAKWWAAGGWLIYDFSAKAGLALRGDYMDDEDGARTSGAPFTAPFPVNTRNKVSTGTATFNVRAWENVLVRPEIRYDHSSIADAFGDKNDQVTFGLSAAYIF